MAEIYSRAKQYPNEVEHLFSFVQVLTACTASFAHGANDVSNAIGPYAVIYSVWSTGESSASKAPVQVWLLVFGGAMIVIGTLSYQLPFPANDVLDHHRSGYIRLQHHEGPRK
jgi:sodium-dependent phosphate transporter